MSIIHIGETEDREEKGVRQTLSALNSDDNEKAPIHVLQIQNPTFSLVGLEILTGNAICSFLLDRRPYKT